MRWIENRQSEEVGGSKAQASDIVNEKYRNLMNQIVIPAPMTVAHITATTIAALSSGIVFANMNIILPQHHIINFLISALPLALTFAITKASINLYKIKQITSDLFSEETQNNQPPEVLLPFTFTRYEEDDEKEDQEEFWRLN